MSMISHNQTIVKTYDQLLEELRKNIETLIALDGFSQVGKTPIANRLRIDLQREIFSLDKYIQNKTGKYVAELDMGKILADINRCNGFAIVEGICMLQVLDKIGLQDIQHVYLKKLRNNNWEDGD